VNTEGRENIPDTNVHTSLLTLAICTSLWRCAAAGKESRDYRNRRAAQGKEKAREREKGERGRRGFRARGRIGGGAKNRDGNASAPRIYAPGRGRDGNLPLMPTCFANLLEAVFSCFAKIR
jgi:hypothetical protein